MVRITFLSRDRQDGGYSVRIGDVLSEDVKHFPWRELDIHLRAYHYDHPTPEMERDMAHALEQLVGPDAWRTACSELMEAGSELSIVSDDRRILHLPWEALTLTPQLNLTVGGQGVLIRYRLDGLPAAGPRKQPETHPESGRILVASNPGVGEAWGEEEVIARYRDVLDFAPARYRTGPTQWLTHIGRAALAPIIAELARAKGAGDAYRILHIVCHGAYRADGGAFGLRLADDVVVSGTQIADALAPFAADLELVMLTVCHGGQGGAVDGVHLFSPAIEIHARGVPAVLAWTQKIEAELALNFVGVVIGKLARELVTIGEAVAAAAHELRHANTLGTRSLRLYATSAEATRRRPIQVAPYRGLRSFDELDARFFFGRDTELERIRAVIERQADADEPRLAALVGASGSGKSSLARAQLARALRASGWIVEFLVADALSRSRLDERIAELLEDTFRVPGRRLIVLDQVEVLLEQTRTAASERGSPALETLIREACHQRSQISVLLVLRSGHVELLERYRFEREGGMLAASTYLEQRDAQQRRVNGIDLGTPDTAFLNTVIRRPAEVAHLQIDGERSNVEALARSLAGTPAALALLAFALHEAWLERRGDHLTLPVDPASRLVAVAEALYLEAPSQSHRAQIERLLLALVEVGDEPSLDGLRSASRGDLTDDKATAAFEWALDELVSRRIVVLTTYETGRAATFRIGHFTLVRTWLRLSDLVNRAREVRLQLRDDERAAESYARAPAPERLHLRGAELRALRLRIASEPWRSHASRRLSDYVAACWRAHKRRRGTWVVAFVALVSVIAAMALTVISQRAIADEEKRRADEEQRRAVEEKRERWARFEARVDGQLQELEDEESFRRSVTTRALVKVLELARESTLHDRPDNDRYTNPNPLGPLLTEDPSARFPRLAALVTRAAQLATLHRAYERRFDVGSQVTALDVSADGRIIALGLADGTLILRLPDAGQEFSYPGESAIRRIQFSIREPLTLGVLADDGLTIVDASATGGGRRRRTEAPREFGVLDYNHFFVVDRSGEIWAHDTTGWRGIRRAGEVTAVTWQASASVPTLQVIERRIIERTLDDDTVILERDDSELTGLGMRSIPIDSESPGPLSDAKPLTVLFSFSEIAVRASWSPSGNSAAICAEGNVWQTSGQRLGNDDDVACTGHCKWQVDSTMITVRADSSCTPCADDEHPSSGELGRAESFRTDAKAPRHESATLLALARNGCQGLLLPSTERDAIVSGLERRVDARSQFIAASLDGSRVVTATARGAIDILQVPTASDPPFDVASAIRRICLALTLARDEATAFECSKVLEPGARSAQNIVDELAPLTEDKSCIEQQGAWGIEEVLDEPAPEPQAPEAAEATEEPVPRLGTRLRLTLHSDCRYGLEQVDSTSHQAFGVYQPNSPIPLGGGEQLRIDLAAGTGSIERSQGAPTRSDLRASIEAGSRLVGRCVESTPRMVRTPARRSKTHPWPAVASASKSDRGTSGFART